MKDAKDGRAGSRVSVSGASVEMNYFDVTGRAERCLFYVCVTVVACTWIIWS